MGQDVSAALRVVHQGLDATDDGGVDTTLRGLVVHAAQEVEEASEAIQLNEACNKPEVTRKYNEDRRCQMMIRKQQVSGVCSETNALANSDV